MHGSLGSPACSKLRAFFHFRWDPNGAEQKIPYRMSGENFRPSSSYKKMPAIDVVEGRQVNDSFIILRNLCTALYGSFDEEWQRRLAYEFQPSLEGDLSQSDVGDWAFNPITGFGIPSCFRCCVEGHIYTMIQNNVRDAADPSIKDQKDTAKHIKTVDVTEFLKEFKAGIRPLKRMGVPFYDGDQPGEHDIALYGVLSPLLFCGIESLEAKVEAAGLSSWVDAMQQKVPLDEMYPSTGGDKFCGFE